MFLLVLIWASLIVWTASADGKSEDVLRKIEKSLFERSEPLECPLLHWHKAAVWKSSLATPSIGYYTFGYHILQHLDFLNTSVVMLFTNTEENITDNGFGVLTRQKLKGIEHISAYSQEGTYKVFVYDSDLRIETKTLDNDGIFKLEMTVDNHTSKFEFEKVYQIMFRVYILIGTPTAEPQKANRENASFVTYEPCVSCKVKRTSIDAAHRTAQWFYSQPPVTVGKATWDEGMSIEIDFPRTFGTGPVTHICGFDEQPLVYPINLLYRKRYRGMSEYGAGLVVFSMPRMCFKKMAVILINKLLLSNSPGKSSSVKSDAVSSSKQYSKKESDNSPVVTVQRKTDKKTSWPAFYAKYSATEVQHNTFTVYGKATGQIGLYLWLPKQQKFAELSILEVLDDTMLVMSSKLISDHKIIGCLTSAFGDNNAKWQKNDLYSFFAYKCTKNPTK